MKRTTGKIIPVSSKKPAYDMIEERRQGILGQRLTLARETKGISVAELQRQLKARGMDIGYMTLFRWEKGETEPTAYQLLALCDLLDVPDAYSYFMRKGLGQQLNEEGLKKLYDYRADLIATGKYAPAPVVQENEIRYIEMPVSLLGASAGTGEFLSGENIELMRFPENAVPKKADFAVRVVGDSMEPVYQDHQLVWVQVCNTLRPGEVGIFIYDGCGYIKQYGERTPDKRDMESYLDSSNVLHKQAVLISYNEKYDPKIVTPDVQFKICGRVLS